MNENDLAIFIINSTDFDQINGSEHLVYNVFIAEEYDLDPPKKYKQYSFKCFTLEGAFQYAEDLSKQFPKIEFVGLI